MRKIEFVIAIPCYKEPELLIRALKSIACQTLLPKFVTISDDSPDDNCKKVVESFQTKLKIIYVKNSTPKGSPENWNNALLMADGEYKILLHHDDEFHDAFALEKLSETIVHNNFPDVIFSSSKDVDSSGKCVSNRITRPKLLNMLIRYPGKIFGNNVLGNPSTVCLSRRVELHYNSKFKWVVDEEFYYRLFKAKFRFVANENVAIIVNLGNSQITNTCLNKEVDFFESVQFFFQIDKNDRSPIVIAKLVAKMSKYRIFSTKEILSLNLPNEILKKLKKYFLAARLYFFMKKLMGRV